MGNYTVDVSRELTEDQIDYRHKSFTRVHGACFSNVGGVSENDDVSLHVSISDSDGMCGYFRLFRVSYDPSVIEIQKFCVTRKSGDFSDSRITVHAAFLLINMMGCHKALMDITRPTYVLTSRFTGLKSEKVGEPVEYFGLRTKYIFDLSDLSGVPGIDKSKETVYDSALLNEGVLI